MYERVCVCVCFFALSRSLTFDICCCMHACIYTSIYLYLYAFTFVAIGEEEEKKKVGHTTQSKANEAVYHSSFILLASFFSRPPISDRFSNELETRSSTEK